MRIYTIGHSNITLEAFAERLLRHGIELLVDVRSAPVSRYVPHFNYDALEAGLRQWNISYMFMGDKVGGRPRGSQFCKPDGSPDYAKMAADELFQEGLRDLMSMAGRSVACMVCSEEDPAKCHRARLVSAHLAALGVEVMHILGDGSLESEQDNARRRTTAGEKQLDLF